MGQVDTTKAYGLTIIGDEILLGRRQDKHFAHTQNRLSQVGMRMAWARFMPDDHSILVNHLKQSRLEAFPVLVFGGIGATPDDITRQAAAEAWGVPLVRHVDAEAEIRQQFGDEAYPNRVRMADLPAGCGLIPNTYNRVPGFFVDQHFFMPGFPQLAWPMLEWILCNHVTSKHDAWYESSVHVFGVGESQLLSVMEALCARHVQVSLFSLPNIEAPRRFIDLGFRGPRAAVDNAISDLEQALRDAHIEFTPAVLVT